MSDIIEQVARIIDPSSWAVMDGYLKDVKRKYKGQDVAWPADQFQHKESMATAREIIAAMQADAEPVAWIVGNGSGNRWRAWQNGSPVWVEARENATRYARREDAEAVHAEDEDAWAIVPYSPVVSHPVTTNPVVVSETGNMSDKDRIAALEAENERKVIVAWLRALVRTDTNWPQYLANRIDEGEHLKTQAQATPD